MVVNVGMWFERFVIICTSLSRDFLPSSWGYFIPTPIDLMTLGGSFGLFFTLFLLFCRYLPMVAMAEVKAFSPRRPRPRRLTEYDHERRAQTYSRSPVPHPYTASSPSTTRRRRSCTPARKVRRSRLHQVGHVHAVCGARHRRRHGHQDDDLALVHAVRRSASAWPPRSPCSGGRTPTTIRGSSAVSRSGASRPTCRSCSSSPCCSAPSRRWSAC